MKKKQFSAEQIVAILKQGELGIPVAELIRQAKSFPGLLRLSLLGLHRGRQDQHVRHQRYSRPYDST